MAVLAATTSPAHAGCWQSEAADQARVRQLDVLLMVSALRCEHGDVPFLEGYNRFVAANRDVIASANDGMRRHFAASMSQAAALNAYDAMVVRMANQFGDGHGLPDCASMAAITDSLADGETTASLASLSAELVGDPELPGGRCAFNLAAGRP